MNDTTLAYIATSLERVAAALERMNRHLDQMGRTGQPVPTEHAEAPEGPQIVPEPEKVEEPEQPAAPAPVAAQPEEKPSVTIDQIRKEVVALSAMGKKDAVREIITSYGRNVSAIPADKYTEVMDKLTALKEG